MECSVAAAIEPERRLLQAQPTGEQWHYGRNVAGHLAEVVCPDGGVVRFAHDALARRVSNCYRGQVKRWVWDGHQPPHEWGELGLNGHNTDEVTTVAVRARQLRAADQVAGSGAAAHRVRPLGHAAGNA